MTQKKETKKKTTAKQTPTPPENEKKDKGKKPQRKSDGRFEKGHDKVGGRVAGTPNRNSNVRDRLKAQVEPFIENIGELLERVKKEEGTNEMLQRIKDFMPYFQPKMQSINLSADQDRPISEEERLVELDARYTKKELSINIKSMTIVDNDKLHELDPEADEDDFDLSIFNTDE
jgi:hypothetical protein